MGIMEDLTAQAITKAWEMLPADKRANIVAATGATETALHKFNSDAADGVLGPDELEADIKLIVDAYGSSAGAAFMAFLTTIFRHA
jgi:hypothetical protein